MNGHCVSVTQLGHRQQALQFCCLLFARDRTIWHFTKTDDQKGTAANKDDSASAIKKWEVTMLEVKSEANLHGFREDRAGHGVLVSIT